MYQVKSDPTWGSYLFDLLWQPQRAALLLKDSYIHKPFFLCWYVAHTAENIVGLNLDPEGHLFLVHNLKSILCALSLFTPICTSQMIQTLWSAVSISARRLNQDFFYTSQCLPNASVLYIFDGRAEAQRGTRRECMASQDSFSTPFSFWNPYQSKCTMGLLTHLSKCSKCPKYRMYSICSMSCPSDSCRFGTRLRMGVICTTAVAV